MLMTCFDQIEDTRVKGRTTYDLKHILLFTVLSLLCQAKGYRDIEVFIDEHFEQLVEMFQLDWEKPPAYTTIRNILLSVLLGELEESFRTHAKKLQTNMEKLTAGKVIKQIAFDGKALCGSVDPSIDKRFIQLVTGFSIEGKFILCHYEVDEKSNEIPAVQTLLKELGLSGYLITADAMNCQKKPLKSLLKQATIS